MSTLNLRKSPISEAVEQIRGVSVPAFRETITAPAGAQASEIQPVIVETPPLDLSQLPDDLMAGVQIDVPSHWSKGALLNVRNRGDHYCITLYPEEFDPRNPERAMMFPNSWTCQDFVSRWYSRETADPRAR